MLTPPTTFCLIGEVVLAPTPHADVTVTVADQEGTTATLVLQPKDLVTYERFQAAVLRETGCRFQYLPWGSRSHPASHSQPIAP
jgi:hypothetical protein